MIEVTDKNNKIETEDDVILIPEGLYTEEELIEILKEIRRYPQPLRGDDIELSNKRNG